MVKIKKLTDKDYVEFKSYAYRRWQWKYPDHARPPWDGRSWNLLHVAFRRIGKDAYSAWDRFLEDNEQDYFKHDPGRFVMSLHRFQLAAQRHDDTWSPHVKGIDDREKAIRKRTAELMHEKFMGHPAARRKAIAEIDGK